MEKDSWMFNLHANGLFSSSALTHLIDEKILPKPSNASETMWNNFLPQKIGIFIWRSLMKRIPVLVELDKRGIDLDSVRCLVCDNDVKTVEHILLNCEFAKDLWESVPLLEPS
ncbi:uncharacterized protein [Rutidosis leptorrhynchoides]|uniref:uncharacterized protein n=1 Tax=Rutidosis leptorrhynchoides TaxID=125765 RepID=UPI003A99B52D